MCTEIHFRLLFGRVAGRIIGYAAFLGKYRIVATPGAIEYGMPDFAPTDVMAITEGDASR